MTDLHADELAARTALAPLDHVPVSARAPAAAANGMLLGILAVVAAAAIATAATAIIHAGTISRALGQRTAQGETGAAKPFGFGDGEGGGALHGCDPASYARSAHREWARLPHDGGRP